MNPNDLCALSTDGRVRISASSVWMLCQALAKARPGTYLIARFLDVHLTLSGERDDTFCRWGMAIVDDQGVDLREHGPDLKLKRRVLIDAPRRPAMGRVE